MTSLRESVRGGGFTGHYADLATGEDIDKWATRYIRELEEYMNVWLKENSSCMDCTEAHHLKDEVLRFLCGEETR